MWSRATVQFWVGIWVNWRRSKGQFLLQDPKQSLALMSVFFSVVFFLNSGYSPFQSETVCKLKLGP